MPTIYDVIRHAETDLSGAKYRAAELREASKAKPDDKQLRAAAERAAAAASKAGRQVAGLRYEAQLDEWIAAMEAGRIVPDETLLKLAGGDDYWLAAAHLARDGITCPDGWRSSVTGELP